MQNASVIDDLIKENRQLKEKVAKLQKNQGRASVSFNETYLEERVEDLEEKVREMMMMTINGRRKSTSRMKTNMRIGIA